MKLKPDLEAFYTGQETDAPRAPSTRARQAWNKRANDR